MKAMKQVIATIVMMSVLVIEMLLLHSKDIESKKKLS